MSGNRLVDLERTALGHLQNNELSEAAVLYLEIVTQQPDYEHGMAFHNLAGCYEDLGEIRKAREAYERALEYGKSNPTILGGYASFLFLHGDPSEAFDTYLELCRIERDANNQSALKVITPALHELGRRIGMTIQAVDGRISSALGEERDAQRKG